MFDSDVDLDGTVPASTRKVQRFSTPLSKSEPFGKAEDNVPGSYSFHVNSCFHRGMKLPQIGTSPCMVTGVSKMHGQVAAYFWI